MLFKNIFLILLISCSTLTNVNAGQFGVGAVLGDAEGLTAAYFVSETKYISASLGLTGGKQNLNGNFLWNKKNLLTLGHQKFDVHFGLGGRFKEKDTTKGVENFLGLRFPLGARYVFTKVSIDIFSELAFIYEIGGPSHDSELSLSLGARYLF